MEKPTPLPADAEEAAPLAYRTPASGAGVPAGRLVGSVLLGLFWLAAAAVGGGLLLFTAMQAVGVDRPSPKREEAIALFVVCAVCLGATSIAGAVMAVWHLVVLPQRMARASRARS